MQHLEKVSADSGGLKQRIDVGMSSLNAQIEDYRSHAALARENDEKYKSLLDLVMHLENKLNQTSKTMVSDLRKELIETLDRNKASSASANDLQSLKRDLETFVMDRESRSEAS